jgi:hypothetical protein
MSFNIFKFRNNIPLCYLIIFNKDSSMYILPLSRHSYVNYN